MNASTSSHLPLTVPLLTLVLQGTAAGALVASAVLLRADHRRLSVEPWAVTAAWSTVGACIALAYAIVALVA